MRQERATSEALLARIAARQHGIVSLRQLLAVGISQDGIKRRVRKGHLHRVYRGVYAVGHTGLGDEGRWIGAVLACGEGAVLSHRSAAELWRLLPHRAGPIHVTVPTSNGRHRRPGIHLHRSGALPPSQTTRRTGIPVTKSARTLADLRGVTSVDEVRRATRQAEFLGLDLGSETSQDQEPTRSRLERRFLQICRRHRLPLPEINVDVGGHEVDFLWREQWLIVETDGYQAHRGRQAFEDDRARDVELRLLGYEVVRISYRQVVDQPRRVAQTLRALLA